MIWLEDPSTQLRNRPGTWILNPPGSLGRIEARFCGAAFTPHRHDTYAVGITLEGVQSFDYRGSARHSLPGQIVVLHPDELHDGRSGDGAPFRYRTAYIAPAEMQRVLSGRTLPFVAGGISDDPTLRRAVFALLEDLAHPLDTLEFEQALHDLTVALMAVAGLESPARIANHAAVTRARDYIHAHLDQSFQLEDLWTSHRVRSLAIVARLSRSSGRQPLPLPDLSQTRPSAPNDDRRALSRRGRSRLRLF